VTKKEALELFKTKVLPAIVAREAPGAVDRAARSEAWGIWIDVLQKSRRITRRQYETWGNPYW
jgi:hypothetical protein